MPLDGILYYIRAKVDIALSKGKVATNQRQNIKKLEADLGI